MSSRRLSNHNSSVGQLKRLEFDTRTLVGREKELEQLKAAYSSGQQPLVGICGYSGVGKTALVETFVREVQEREEDSKTWFTFGKYDQQTSSMPYSAISFALSKLASEHEGKVSALCTESEMDEDEIAKVLGIVPDLKRCFAQEDKTTKDEDEVHSGACRPEQLRSALASFIQILSKNHRLVICLDDVQWADTASLELIESLAAIPGPIESNEGTPEGSSNLSLIMIWRSNELESATAVRNLLSRCPPLIIEVGNLTVESLNEMLAHTLERRLNDDSVMELTKVIHRKTQGNGETICIRELEYDLFLSAAFC